MDSTTHRCRDLGLRSSHPRIVPRIPTAILAVGFMLLALLPIVASLSIEGYGGGKRMIRKLLRRMLHLMRLAVGIPQLEAEIRLHLDSAILPRLDATLKSMEERNRTLA